MPLSADNIVQENWGAVSAASASVSPSLPSGTTAGNTLLVIINTDELSSGITPPTTAWTKDTPPTFDHNSFTGFYFAHRSNVPAGETSWTFTPSSGTRQWAWYIAEISGLDPMQPVDAGVGTDNTTGVSSGTSPTRSTGNTPANPGLATVAIAAFGSTSASNGSAPGTWDSYTNGFVEAAETATTSTGSVTNRGLAVARTFYDSITGPFECTGTYTAGPGIAQNAYGGMIVLRAADSPIVTPLQWCSGFEFGTANGINGGSTGAPRIADGLAGTIGTNVIVQGSSARNGSYGLQIVQSGSAAYIGLNATSSVTALPGGLTVLVPGFSVRHRSGTGVLVAAEFAPGAGTVLQLVYDATNSKYGLRWGLGGTVAYQSGTVASNVWAWVTIRISGLGMATWHAEFQVEESGILVDQTGPADLTGQTGSTLATVRLGFNGTQTSSFDFDDPCLSTAYPVYPLGIHKVLLLTVDPAGTPVSTAITIGDFALLTSNATGAALTSGTLTNARDGLDEVPPIISASSDGILQTAVDTGYIEFPMQTYTCSATEIIAGVRLVACWVSTTGAGAGNAGIFGYDGAAETTLVGTGFTWTPGSSTTVSSTIPPWATAQWNPAGGWTQSKLDAAALRFGKSTDATPDMGVHAMYLEVAIGPARTARMFGTDGDVTVDAAVNPNSLGTRSLTTATPAGKGTGLHYEVSGSPTDVTVAPTSTDTQTPDTPAKPTLNYVAIYPDPEGVADT